jgi:ribonuclease G
MVREYLFSRHGGRLWAALREDGVTVELRVEGEEDGARFGRIIKARVARVMPGMQSAFVDIGDEHNALLHARDLAGPEGPIEERLRPGGELAVQVSREGQGSKGAKVTTFLSIAGRLLVLLPQDDKRAVSRRIREEEERARLSRIVEGLPAGGPGVVARTAARGAAESDIAAEAELLAGEWEEIRRRISSTSAPGVVHMEAGLLEQLIKEASTGDVERLLFDDERDWLLARDSSPVLAPRTELRPAPPTLFDSMGLGEDAERALRSRVWLKSGGYIVIEETEALVSIDVNTGKYLGGRDLEETALRTNLEAAGEIARQLRLRDLGGVVVVDFVDMASDESRESTLERLRQRLAEDPARTKIVGMSELDILQLTRKRARPALGALLTAPCPECGGRGRIVAPEL